MSGTSGTCRTASVVLDGRARKARAASPARGVNAVNQGRPRPHAGRREHKFLAASKACPVDCHRSNR